MHSPISANAAQRRPSLAALRLWVLLCMILNAVEHPRAVKATDDVANVSPCELESIINQLVYPNPEYQLHASALRSQLRTLLRNRQLPVGDEQAVDDYDYPDEDKRSLASLASQGLLRPEGKRSLGTLAKNGQLPTPNPEEIDTTTIYEDKRYVGALARSGGGMLSYGKRNIGTLARDFQLPQNGKRNLATLARLGLLTSANPKRNVAHLARYNSNRISATPAAVEKRNLGALKGSPVHGAQQKRDEEEQMLVPTGGNVDYMDLVPSYWMYPSYADMDWNDYARAQKRYLGRVLPPTRATASTNRSRL